MRTQLFRNCATSPLKRFDSFSSRRERHVVFTYWLENAPQSVGLKNLSGVHYQTTWNQSQSGENTVYFLVFLVFFPMIRTSSILDEVFSSYTQHTSSLTLLSHFHSPVLTNWKLSLPGGLGARNRKPKLKNVDKLLEIKSYFRNGCNYRLQLLCFYITHMPCMQVYDFYMCHKQSSRGLSRVLSCSSCKFCHVVWKEGARENPVSKYGVYSMNKLGSRKKLAGTWVNATSWASSCSSPSEAPFLE